MKRSLLFPILVASALALGATGIAWADEASGEVESTSKVAVLDGEVGVTDEALALDEAEPSAQAASDEATDAADDAFISAQATTSAVSKPTQDQIRQYLLTHKINSTAAPEYAADQTPSTVAPGKAGQLTTASANNGLNMLNWIRYIAGIQSVTLDESYNEICQAASLIMAWNGGISHYPTQPNGMSDELYELGAKGASRSNISMGYAGPAATVLGYMSDSDSNNLSRVGHRQWCLDPYMGKTGFGYAGRCSAMYSFDVSNTATPQYEAITWPANNTPSAIFSRNDAWSFSADWIEAGDTTLSVDIVRQGDGKTWQFKNPTVGGNSNSSGGYFATASTVCGGLANDYLIFLPYTNGKAGLDRLYDQDTYKVTVTSTQRNKSYTYSVTFFQLFPADKLTVIDHIEGNAIGSSLTLPLTTNQLYLFVSSSSSKLPAQGSSLWFDGADRYALIDANEYPTSWANSNSGVLKLQYGQHAGYYTNSYACISPLKAGTSKLTIKHANLAKQITVTVPSSNNSGNTGNTGNSGSTGSGNTGPSNVVKPTSPSNAPTVGGSWVKSGSKWWYSYNSTTQKAQKKSYPANDWATISGKRYHFDSKGYMNTGWQKLSNTWYYFGSDGALRTGWQKISNTWYFLNRKTGAMATGWAQVDGSWYYLKSSGAMATGWAKVNSTWYYLKSSGAMATGWAKVGGSWYYLKSSGAMATGWAKVGNTWYYLNSSGVMATGWAKVSGKWYYLNSSGAMLANQWVGNYYVQSDGSMATNKWIGRYYVNGSGLWAATR